MLTGLGLAWANALVLVADAGHMFRRNRPRLAWWAAHLSTAAAINNFPWLSPFSGGGFCERPCNGRSDCLDHREALQR